MLQLPSVPSFYLHLTNGIISYMQKIKAALYVFTQSLTSPKYYKDIIKTDLRFSLKYYVVLSLVFALVSATYTLVPLLPKINEGIDEGISYALALYEDDLVITIEGGKLSINKEEPYIIPLPVGGNSDLPSNVIVFDSEGTLDDLEGWDTFVLVNSANILIKNESEIRVYPTNRLPDSTLTKQDLVSLTEQLRDFSRFVPYLVGIVLLLAVLFYYLVFRLIYLLVVGGFLRLIGYFKGATLSYEKYYKIGVHAMTLPLCIELLNNFFGVYVTGLPWFFMIHLIFGGYIVFTLCSGSDVSVGEVTAEGEENAEEDSTETESTDSNE